MEVRYDLYILGMKYWLRLAVLSILPETKYWRAARARFDIYLLPRLICCNFSLDSKRTMRLRAMLGLSVEIKSEEKLPVITAFLFLCLQTPDKSFPAGS